MTCNDIYYLKPSASSSDRKKLVELLPLFIDWQMHHPAEPFNAVKAKAEFGTHAANSIKRTERRRAYAVKLRLKAEEELKDYCTKLAEEHLQVYYRDEMVNWGQTIFDPETNAKIGKVREIMAMRKGFDRGIDPRIKRDEYLEEIRRLFDGTDYNFKFDRPETIREKLKRIGQVVSEVEEAPFKPKDPDKIYRYVLRVVWK